MVGPPTSTAHDIASYSGGVAAGFAVGFGKGAWSLISGPWQMIKWTYNATTDTLGTKMAWVYTLGKTQYFSDTEKEMGQVANTTAHIMADLATEIQQIAANNPEVLVQASLGNYAPLAAHSQTLQQAVEIGAELLRKLKDYWDELTFKEPYDAGYEIGQVIGGLIFNIALLVIPVGELLQATKVTVLTKLFETLQAGNIFEKSSTAFNASTEAFRLLGVSKDATTGATVIADAGFVGTFQRCVGTMCFVAGTEIWTVDGLRPIESIRPGDEVLSRNIETGVQEYKPVVQTFVTHPPNLYHLSYTVQTNSGLQLDTIVTTAPHPFYVVNRGEFVPAAELQPGDIFLLANGGTAQFSSEWVENAPKGSFFTTYNFEVQDDHTYFVGADGIWVHNSGAPCVELANWFADLAKAEGQGSKQAFKTVIETLQASETLKAKYNGALHLMVDGAMKEMFADATANGVDLSKVMSYSEMNSLTKGLRRINNMEANHTVAQYIQKWLKIPESEWNDVPAELLELGEHQNQAGSFHALLKQNGLAPTLDGVRPAGLSDSDILNRLEKTYQQFDRKEVWEVAETWLERHGIKRVASNVLPGDLIVPNGAELALNIDNRVHVLGAAFLAGTLSVGVDPDEDYTLLRPGYTATLLVADNGINGQFQDVTGFPGLAAGRHWQIYYSSNTVTAEVMPQVEVAPCSDTPLARNVDTPNIILAGITDFYGDGDPSAYSVNIDWGDGSHNSGYVTWGDNTGTDFQAMGDHRYTQNGTYAVTLTITHDADENSAVIQTTLTVESPPLARVTDQAGMGYGGVTGDGFTAYIDDNYNLVIDWDNGTEEVDPLPFGVAVWNVGPNQNIPYGPTVFKADAQGNVWLTTIGASNIIEIYSCGTNFGSLDGGIVMGFAVEGNYTAAIISGHIGSLAVPGANGIAVDATGTIWFTDIANNAIATIVNGHLTEQTIPTANSWANSPVVDAFGNVYFAERSAIGEFVRSTGRIIEIPLPSDSYPGSLFVDGSNNLWFTEPSSNTVGEIVPSGSMNTFLIPTLNAYPTDIVWSWGGTVFFSESSLGYISSIETGGVSTLSAHAGQVANWNMLAVFDGSDPTSAASNYTAVIDWGDHTTSNGTISPATWYDYQIGASHTYANAGNYAITVTITYIDGSKLVLDGSVLVQ